MTTDRPTDTPSPTRHRRRPRTRTIAIAGTATLTTVGLLSAGAYSAYSTTGTAKTGAFSVKDNPENFRPVLITSPVYGASSDTGTEATIEGTATPDATVRLAHAKLDAGTNPQTSDIATDIKTDKKGKWTTKVQIPKDASQIGPYLYRAHQTLPGEKQEDATEAETLQVVALLAGTETVGEMPECGRVTHAGPQIGWKDDSGGNSAGLVLRSPQGCTIAPGQKLDLLTHETLRGSDGSPGKGDPYQSIVQRLHSDSPSSLGKGALTITGANRNGFKPEGNMVGDYGFYYKNGIQRNRSPHETATLGVPYKIGWFGKVNTQVSPSLPASSTVTFKMGIALSSPKIDAWNEIVSSPDSETGTVKLQAVGYVPKDTAGTTPKVKPYEVPKTLAKQAPPQAPTTPRPAAPSPSATPSPDRPAGGKVPGPTNSPVAPTTPPQRDEHDKKPSPDPTRDEDSEDGKPAKNPDPASTGR